MIYRAVRLIRNLFRPTPRPNPTPTTTSTDLDLPFVPRKFEPKFPSLPHKSDFQPTPSDYRMYAQEFVRQIDRKLAELADHRAELLDKIAYYKNPRYCRWAEFIYRGGISFSKKR